MLEVHRVEAIRRSLRMARLPVFRSQFAVTELLPLDTAEPTEQRDLGADCFATIFYLSALPILTCIALTQWLFRRTLPPSSPRAISAMTLAVFNFLLLLINISFSGR
jgi:hypothetical protein